MFAGMLAHDQVGAHQADVFRAHDLIGAGVLQHAVLVNAGLMLKGVHADDRLVGLDGEAGNRGDQAGRAW